MRSNGLTSAGLVGLCAIMVACDDGGSEVLAPEVSPVDMQFNTVAGPARASGNVYIHGTPVQNVQDEILTFSAVSTGNGTEARGQLEMHAVLFVGGYATVHAEVTCMSVVANQAWIGARVTFNDVRGDPLPSVVGYSMVIRVQDMGEGQDAVDLSSLGFFSNIPGFDLTHCETRPSFPILRATDRGNIQVRAP